MAAIDYLKKLADMVHQLQFAVDDLQETPLQVQGLGRLQAQKKKDRLQEHINILSHMAQSLQTMNQVVPTTHILDFQTMLSQLRVQTERFETIRVRYEDVFKAFDEENHRSQVDSGGFCVIDGQIKKDQNDDSTSRCSVISDDEWIFLSIHTPPEAVPMKPLEVRQAEFAMLEARILEMTQLFEQMKIAVQRDDQRMEYIEKKLNKAEETVCAAEDTVAKAKEMRNNGIPARRILTCALAAGLIILIVIALYKFSS